MWFFCESTNWLLNISWMYRVLSFKAIFKKFSMSFFLYKSCSRPWMMFVSECQSMWFTSKQTLSFVQFWFILVGECLCGIARDLLNTSDPLIKVSTRPPKKHKERKGYLIKFQTRRIVLVDLSVVNKKICNKKLFFHISDFFRLFFYRKSKLTVRVCIQLFTREFNAIIFFSDFRRIWQGSIIFIGKINGNVSEKQKCRNNRLVKKDYK